MSLLTASDLAAYAALGISTSVLEAAQLERVDDADARRILSTNRPGDLSGIIFPYLHPSTGRVTTHRLRRDSPDVENGKPKAKYISVAGRQSRVYFPPNCAGKLSDPTVRLYVVEAEKSVLSLASAGAFAIGLGGCWGWRGRIGKTESANGARVDEVGVLPDLDRLAWEGREAVIAFDSNAASSPKVRAARRELAKVLTERGAVVKVLDVPVEDGVNGPDDYVGKHGAAAFFELLKGIESTDGTNFPNTEVGDAEAFVHAYKDRVRYDHAQGRWLMTSETGVWVPDPTEVLRSLTVDVMRDRQKRSILLDDPDQKKRAFKWAVDGESSRRMSNALREARAMPPVADEGTNWDRDPFLIGVQNGVVDLLTGELRRADPSERVTMRTKVAYDKYAECPLWEQTFSEVFNHQHDLVDYVWRAIGYSLTGDCREECFFVNWGEGGNGKGTIMNTVAWLLQDYADNLPFSSLEQTERNGIPTDIAKLVGKRFVTASESGEAVQLNEARIKALTGQDPITARFLHRNFFTFQPVAKFWLASNKKPLVKDDSEGFWRRVHLIPFTQNFGERGDKTLKNRLREEAQGILTWAVQGAIAWLREGLNPPTVVKVATEAYRHESEPLASFLLDCCVLAINASVQASVLYGEYKRWTERAGLRDREKMSQMAFGLAMRKRFLVDEGRHTFYVGLGLRAATDEL